MFDQGQGPPVVVIPGLQGRWEWAKPALRQLSAECRAISYSLAGDIGSRRSSKQARRLEDYVQQLDAVLDQAGLERAAICGVSFGGFVALAYAAARPQRVSALILASAPGPGFTPNPQQARWLARPWLSAPVFVATAPLRIWPELSASFPTLRGRLAFLVRQALRCAVAPMNPSLMSIRMRSARTVDFEADCRRIAAPTLVVTGEDGLDRVVPVPSTRTYLSLIPGAECRTLERTGHMGLLTQPSTFARVVTDFVHAHHH